MPVEFRMLKQSEAEALFRRIGITFAVYGEGGDPDRLIPFDMFPRIFAAEEWRKLERGIKQRARALNAFLMVLFGLALTKMTRLMMSLSILYLAMVKSTKHYKIQPYAFWLANRLYCFLKVLRIQQN